MTVERGLTRGYVIVFIGDLEAAILCGYPRSIAGT